MCDGNSLELSSFISIAHTASLGACDLSGVGVHPLFSLCAARAGNLSTDLLESHAVAFFETAQPADTRVVVPDNKHQLLCFGNEDTHCNILASGLDEPLVEDILNIPASIFVVQMWHCMWHRLLVVSHSEQHHALGRTVFDSRRLHRVTETIIVKQAKLNVRAYTFLCDEFPDDMFSMLCKWQYV